jgi:hypothetical protein
MARTITVGSDQPAISPRPKKGEPITQDQFSLDFEVEVEQDGCYAIEFVLKEHRTFPVTDDVILSSESAYAQPICLHAGKTTFRITTSKPAPAGAVMPPAAPAGTITLPPVDGHWPTHPISSAEFYCEITVYRLADCAATPPQCAPFYRPSLGKENKYVTYAGEKIRTARELALALPSLDLPNDGVFASLDHERTPAVMGFASSAPVSVSASPQVLFELQRAATDDTFFAPGVIASRYEIAGGSRRLSARVVLKDTYPALEDLGAALVIGERISQELTAGNNGNLLRGYLATQGIVRHGRATLYDVERGPLSTFFVEDRSFNAIYLGLGPPGTRFLADLLLADSAPAATPAPPPAPEPEDVSVAFPDDFAVGLSVHLFAPLVNIFARIAFKYEKNVALMISEVFDPMIAKNQCIKRLRIHSHGGPLPGGESPVTNGSFIRMGKGADGQQINLRSDDFDANGVAQPGTVAADLIAKLNAVMCHPSEIIFDACHQGIGELLKNLSRALGPDRTVKGYADTGVPWGEGDRSYTNGAAT